MAEEIKVKLKIYRYKLTGSIINQSHPFKKVWKYGQVLFILFEVLYSGGFFKSFVDFTGQHETVATSRASHRVDENTTFIKTSDLDRLDDYFNIFFSIS